MTLALYLVLSNLLPTVTRAFLLSPSGRFNKLRGRVTEPRGWLFKLWEEVGSLMLACVVLSLLFHFSGLPSQVCTQTSVCIIPGWRGLEGSISASTDARHVAYTTNRGDKWVVLVDGEQFRTRVPDGLLSFGTEGRPHIEKEHPRRACHR